MIQVEDINDKPPSFSKQLFIHHVAEVTPVGTQVNPFIKGMEWLDSIVLPAGSSVGCQ